jgi:adenylate kinase family enzyme
MERIVVIGCGGSGKTTLSNQLGDRLGLPVFHIDGVYWRDVPALGRVESTPEEWANSHRSLIAQRRWVIDGMKLGTLPERFQAADTAIFLDLPTRICLWGVASRRLRSRTSVRPDLGTFEVRISRAFLGSISNFRRVQRPKILALLASYPCDVVILRSRPEVNRFLSSLPSESHRLAA